MARGLLKRVTVKLHALGLVASTALVIGLASACSSSSGSASPTPASDAAPAANDAGEVDAEAAAAPDPFAARPYSVFVPPGHDSARPAPLVLAFHGYGDGDNGTLLEKYFRIKPIASSNDFLYVTPEGSKDKHGEQFWNGTDACCDFDASGVDDVAYVRALVADVSKKHAVDPKRVYAVGLSGGAFFVHRLACEASDLFAAVVSVSGATWSDASRCKPAGHISVAELHGEEDDVVLYAGGTLKRGKINATYPSADATAAHWATYNGCTGPRAQAATMELVSTLAGEETRVERYPGCTRGAVELWSIAGGGHAPSFGSSLAPALWAVFSAHPKP